MKIKGQLQWTDYLNAQMLHAQPSGFIRIFIYVFYYFFFTLTFIGMIYLFLIGEYGREKIYLVFLSVLILFFPVLYRKLIMPNQVKKSFTQIKALSLPFEMEFTETGVYTSNELGNGTIPWDHFTKWNENEDIINLYQYDTIIHMIPKRFFADSQQIEIFKSLLEKNKVAKVKNPFWQKETG
jgi:hypothetical protein